MMVSLVPSNCWSKLHCWHSLCRSMCDSSSSHFLSKGWRWWRTSNLCSLVQTFPKSCGRSQFLPALLFIASLTAMCICDSSVTDHFLMSPYPQFRQIKQAPIFYLKPYIRQYDFYIFCHLWSLHMWSNQSREEVWQDNLWICCFGMTRN